MSKITFEDCAVASLIVPSNSIISACETENLSVIEETPGTSKVGFYGGIVEIEFPEGEAVTLPELRFGE